MEIPVLLAIVAGLWVALVLAGGLEALKHRWLVSRIPVRVHVNGTRGKTSVTRLIAAGLRAGGKACLCKNDRLRRRSHRPRRSRVPNLPHQWRKHH